MCLFICNSGPCIGNVLTPMPPCPRSCGSPSSTHFWTGPMRPNLPQPWNGSPPPMWHYPTCKHCAWASANCRSGQVPHGSVPVWVVLHRQMGRRRLRLGSGFWWQAVRAGCGGWTEAVVPERRSVPDLSVQAWRVSGLPTEGL